MLPDPTAAQCLLHAHAALQCPSSLPTTSPASSPIPLWKQDLWQHLTEVKKLTFSSIPLNPKRKPVDDLALGMSSLRIDQRSKCLIQSFKKLKISQDEPTMPLQTLPKPAQLSPACVVDRKEQVPNGSQSSSMLQCKFPRQLKPVSSVHEDSLGRCSDAEL